MNNSSRIIKPLRIHKARPFLLVGFRSLEIPSSASGREMGRRPERHDIAKQLCTNSGHSFRWLCRRDNVEPEYWNKRGLSIRKRRYTTSQAYQCRCYGMDFWGWVFDNPIKSSAFIAKLPVTYNPWDFLFVCLFVYFIRWFLLGFRNPRRLRSKDSCIWGKCNYRVYAVSRRESGLSLLRYRGCTR